MQLHPDYIAPPPLGSLTTVDSYSDLEFHPKIVGVPVFVKDKKQFYFLAEADGKWNALEMGGGGGIGGGGLSGGADWDNKVIIADTPSNHLSVFPAIMNSYDWVRGMPMIMPDNGMLTGFARIETYSGQVSFALSVGDDFTGSLDIIQAQQYPPATGNINYVSFSLLVSKGQVVRLANRSTVNQTVKFGLRVQFAPLKPVLPLVPDWDNKTVICSFDISAPANCYGSQMDFYPNPGVNSVWSYGTNWVAPASGYIALRLGTGMLSLFMFFINGNPILPYKSTAWGQIHFSCPAGASFNYTLPVKEGDVVCMGYTTPESSATKGSGSIVFVPLQIV